MLKGKTLKDYAKLVVNIGVNLQKGQGLEIVCPTEKREIAIALAEAGYEAGAKIVRVRWEDEEINKINYANAEADALTEVPKWLVDSRNYLVDNGFCYIAVSADDPEAAADKLLNSGMVKWLAGKDTEKYKKTFISMADKNRKFTETTLYNVNETCYTFDCPEMSTEAQKTFLFIYSDDEPAHMSKKKMMKHYPAADFRDMHKLGHCGFQMSKPEEYADFISAQISL